MRSDTEWGPWIDHDGKRCPCSAGVRMQIYMRPGCAIRKDGEDHAKWEFTVNEYALMWRNWEHVERYRVRKPRALLDLIELVENLPAPAKPQVPA